MVLNNKEGLFLFNHRIVRIVANEIRTTPGKILKNKEEVFTFCIHLHPINCPIDKNIN